MKAIAPSATTSASAGVNAGASTAVPGFNPDTGRPAVAKFDPETGQPITQAQAVASTFGNRFDPNTGQPILKFDTETGKQNW